MKKARIACVQMDCILGDPAYNLGQIVDHIGRAADAAADLVIFPECAVTGYCYDSLEEASRFSEPVNGPSFEAIAGACSRAGLFAIAGFIEKDGPSFYNAAMLVGPDGLVGGYRKVHLPYLGVDRFLTPGDRPFEVFDLPFGRVGVNICYDASFPEGSRVLKLLGAQLIVLPTNWPPGAWRTPKFTVNSRANENHVYFAAVDRVGTERGWRFIGNSKVVDYNGDTIAEAGPEKEEVLIVELDLQAADDNKSVFVPGKHEVDRIGDRRPEFYTLVSKTFDATFKKAGD
jgi:predicted amidohydrolase